MVTQSELEIAVTRQRCEADPLFFTRYFFKHREGMKFIVNWHHRKIAKILLDIEAGMYDGHVVIINVSPGSSKTQMVVVNWMARSLAINPRARFLHLSYSDQLAEQNSLAAKDIVLSDEYQELWPLRIRPDSKSKKRWNVIFNDGGVERAAGGVYATSMRGQITGFRAGHMATGFQGAIIIDDPLSPDMAGSTAERNRINEILVNTIKSRKANPATPILMIMQRVHENDPTGFLKAGGLSLPVKHIKIPAIMQDDDGNDISYWEYKEPIKALIKERDEGSPTEKYVFYGQYMQEPAPVGNGEFAKEHIQFFNPDHENFSCQEMNIWIFYDPANSKKANADWTAMVVLGLAPDKNLYILDLVRDRLNPTERVDKLIKLHKKWNVKSGKPPRVAIEQYGMMTDKYYIKKAQDDINYRFSITEVAGRLSKEDRIRRLIPDWGQDRVYIRDKTLYNDYKKEIRDLTLEFIEDELMLFPVGSKDDMIDALTRVYDVDAVFPQEQIEYFTGGQTIRHEYGNYNNNDFMSW